MSSTSRAVKAAMAEHDMSQLDLGSAIGCSQRSLSRRLRGEVDFRVPELQAIARVLDVPVSRLLGEEERAA